MSQLFTTQLRLLAKKGFTLPEVLISLALFSVVVTGVYIVGNSIGTSIAETQKTDMEAAFANMKMAEVNLSDKRIEIDYDKTAKTPAGTLANGALVYWTRLVDSCPTSVVNDPDCNSVSAPSDPQEVNTPDVKRISIFLYKTATSPTPYRVFKKQIPPQKRCYSFGWIGDPGKVLYHKDPAGQVWVNMTADIYNQAASKRPGFDYSGVSTGTVSSYYDTTCPTIPAVAYPSSEPYPWCYTQDISVAPNRMTLVFPASVDKTYKVDMGWIENSANTPVVNAAGQRVFNVILNGVQVGTIDPYANVGNMLSRPLTKSYTTLGKVDASAGYGTIRVVLEPNGAPPRTPSLNWLCYTPLN